MTPHSTTSAVILNQLIDVISQLNDEQYAMPVELLSGNSIGKHIRHIVEFYQCLSLGYPDGVIDYDARKRNVSIETKVNVGIDALRDINNFVNNATDKLLKLSTVYPGNIKASLSDSSFSREVVYNIEHAIHHMAIIKIAIKATFHYVVLPDNFGVAFSTLQHLDEVCAQ